MMETEKRKSFDFMGDSMTAVVAISLVIIVLSLYSVLSMLSPIVKTFNEVVVDKKTNIVVVLVDKIAVPVTQYFVVTESGKQIQVTPNQYSAINIGDTVLVAIKQNGEYILDNNGGVK